MRWWWCLCWGLRLGGKGAQLGEWEDSRACHEGVMRCLHDVFPNEVVQKVMTATQIDVDSS